MTENLKISIITPNYNYANYIGETIKSVVNQSYKNIEHIIVDDGSTDNSVEIITKYKEKYPEKIKLIQQKNKGQTPAINRALEEVTGDIICWINSDDTFCKHTFNLVINEFTKNPKTDIVFGNMNAMDIKGKFIYERRHLKFDYKTGCLLGFTTILSSNAVFWKTKIMYENFKEDLLCNMDGEFYSRLTKGRNVVQIKAPLANFRKQAFTKASENKPDWDKLVKKEVEYELKNSYKNLGVSKYIPYSYSNFIRYFFRAKRIFFRTLHFHFIKQYFEKKRYYSNNNKKI